MIVVITYLVARWIEKHHPQKQYNLIVKKGLNYVTKHAKDYQKLAEKYQTFVK
jgi:hypothetical protein